ncbi:MAG: hypothetical protein LBL47_02945 [Lactobacillus sp.]|jgi:hypothetical protein|nr:hypothetical protein [Lactobacillus sp.]
MNLWMLTEERPKIEVLQQILNKFASDRGYCAFIDNLRILPILEDSKFSFTYELIGFKCNKVGKIFIKTVSGYSSFVDFLVFFQDKEPTVKDKPVYAIEETKTDDSESRNTGVYQRCSKFVFLNYYYPEVKMIMLYNLQIKQKETPTQTNIFGTRMLITLGVEILGKELDRKVFTPFSSIKELIDFKKSMRAAPKGNVPIEIAQTSAGIEVSGRLIKSDNLSHDPNIGALSLISATLRKLGWKKDVIITKHGLLQKHLTGSNKFILIANRLNLSLKGLKLPKAAPNSDYWRYDLEGEKLGTIFIHIVVESFTKGYSIFENHAGSEKGYFITAKGEHIPLAKYADKAKYKVGDKSKIIHIPDLILIDFGRSEVINVEGKKYQFRKAGIAELKNYGFIEKNYIKKYYPKFEIVRTIVLYGSKEKKVVEIKVGFLLNEEGALVLGVKAPALFKQAIKNLLDFWS